MISLTIGKCAVNILPVVNGLVSEAEKVKNEYGKYEAYAASLGIEALQALKQRESIGVDDIEVSELDIAYAKKMSVFGEIQVPSPAFCELVDRCAADGTQVIALDMNDTEFDDAYLECVSAVEFTTVHRLAKKGYAAKMDESSPEALALDWDRWVSKKKGFGRLDRMREKHIAEELMDIAKYRTSILAVIEVERVNGILEILKVNGYAA